MDIEELRNSLEFLFNPNSFINLELYLVLKTENGTQLRFANLGDGDLSTEIKNGFIQQIRKKTHENIEVNVLPLSELNSERTTIHYYDFPELPEGLEIINENLSPDIQIFNFDRDSLTTIKAFLIKLSSINNRIVLYKSHSHLNLLRQNNIFYLIKDNERFTRVQEDILKFSFSFDFMKVQDNIMVYNIDCLEREFMFDEILTLNAERKVDMIRDLNYVENIDALYEFTREKSGAKKILSIRLDSPVLNLRFDQIKEFVQNHPYLERRLRFNNDGSRFVLDTKASRTHFINLLNDNFLTSNLTSIYYQTKAKTQINGEQNEQEN